MDRFAKLRAVACRFWCIPPWEFDAAMDSGKILMEDVTALTVVILHDPTQILLAQWLYPEEVELQKERAKAAKNELQYNQGLAFLQPKQVKYLQPDGTYAPLPPGSHITTHEGTTDEC